MYICTMAALCDIGLIVEETAIRSTFCGICAQLEAIFYPRVGKPIQRQNYKLIAQKNGKRVYALPRCMLARIKEHMDVRDLLSRHTIADWSRSAVVSTDTSVDRLSFLFDNQKLIVHDILNRWRGQNHASLCLNLRAGYGKTFIGAGLIMSMAQMIGGACCTSAQHVQSAHPFRALYIVPTIELARQTCKDINSVSTSLFGRDDYAQHVVASDIQGAICGSHITASVLVMVINTALNVLESPVVRRAWFGAQSAAAAQQQCNTLCVFPISLVIFDEVHMYCSEARSEIFWRTQARYMFGMSATTSDRRDGFDCIFQQHLAPLIEAEKIEGFTYGENTFKVRVRALHYRAANPRNMIHEATGKVFAHYMYEQFAADMARNRMIIEQINDMIARNHNIFVFAEERAHIEKLASMYETIPGHAKYILFYGGIGDEVRAAALGTSAPPASSAQPAHVIFATYSYSGTGISIVRMSGIILASPRYANMKQIIGRILRRGSDPAIVREVVDILDKGTCLCSQWRMRKQAYDYYGAEYEKRIVDYKAYMPAGTDIDSIPSTP